MHYEESKSDWEFFVDDNNEMVDTIAHLGWGVYNIVEMIFSEWRILMFSTFKESGTITIEVDGEYVIATETESGLKFDITDYTIHGFMGIPVSKTIH